MADQDNNQDKISKAAEKAMSNLKADDIQKLLSNPSAMAGISQQLAAQINQTMGLQDQLSMLPLAVRKRIRALKNFQLATTELESQFYIEVQRLEAKYMALYQPVFDKRRDIVTGSREPTDEEAHWSEDEGGDEEEPVLPSEQKSDAGPSKTNGASNKDDDDEPTTGIEEFWLIAFKNCEIFADIIKEHDEPVLKHLIDLKVVYVDDSGLDFSLEFCFSDNEWFTNKVLTKSYKVACVVNKDDPWAFEGASITEGKGCSIDWKKGKNITVKTVKKKQKHKGKGQQARTVTKTIPNESFFNMFSPPSLEPKDGASEDDEDIAQTLSDDYTRAEFIRDRLVPKAVLFFTGEALDEDGDDGDFDDDFDDDDDDLEGDDYDPQKQLEEVKQPECKQQ